MSSRQLLSDGYVLIKRSPDVPLRKYIDLAKQVISDQLPELRGVELPVITTGMCRTLKSKWPASNDDGTWHTELALATGYQLQMSDLTECHQLLAAIYSDSVLSRSQATPEPESPRSPDYQNATPSTITNQQIPTIDEQPPASTYSRLLQTHCRFRIRSSISSYLPCHAERWVQHDTYSCQLALTSQTIELVPLTYYKHTSWGIVLVDTLIYPTITIKLEPGDILVHHDAIVKAFPPVKNGMEVTITWSWIPADRWVEQLNDKRDFIVYPTGRRADSHIYAYSQLSISSRKTFASLTLIPVLPFV